MKIYARRPIYVFLILQQWFLQQRPTLHVDLVEWNGEYRIPVVQKMSFVMARVGHLRLGFALRVLRSGAQCPWSERKNFEGQLGARSAMAVSYTHLTLPTILLV